jgi:farnesyl diphosphate synthase
MDWSMMSDFSARLETVARTVEDMMADILGDNCVAGEVVRPPQLMAAMRHGALNGGKRLRPFLLIETACLFGADGPGVVRSACALELVHCYSLVHDDLPAMDDDDLRRGKPTVHKAFDEATAILAGDSLLTLAFSVMADPRVHDDGGIRARLVGALAAAAGPGGMAGGQMLDLAAEVASKPLDEAAIWTLQAMKTGALIRFACEAGAIIGGAADGDQVLLSGFGAKLGLLFQITDDLLDATSDAATLGKAAGKDAGRNKATLVSLLGVEGAEALRDREEIAARQLLVPFGERAQVLEAALHFACARKY